MRRYAAGDEECLRTAAQVRDWRHSGLITASQASTLTAALQTDLKRTNRSIRALLFIFGSIIALAALFLTLESVGFTNESVVGWAALMLSAFCLIAADILAGPFRLYRFGVEEALASWAVALAGGGVYLILSRAFGETAAQVAALSVIAVVALALYLRYGYVYLGVVAVFSAALAAGSLDIGSPAVRRVAVALVLAIVAAAARRQRGRLDDFRRDGIEAIEAAAWLGGYLALNLVASNDVLGFRVEEPSPHFYWITYALTWVLPVCALALALSERQRFLLWTGLGIALVTCITSKPYLGWPRTTWDPIALGTAMVALSVTIRRWMLVADTARRRGFTPERLLASQRRVAEAMGSLSGLSQPLVQTLQPAAVPEPPPEFRGGRSGGGGGGADF